MNPGRWAVRYGDRQCRLFCEYLAASRFFVSHPLARSLLGLRYGAWENLAWHPAGREN
jgi:hypothetical protein